MLPFCMNTIMRVLKLLSNILFVNRHDFENTLVVEAAKRVDLIMLIYSEVTSSPQPLTLILLTTPNRQMFLPKKLIRK